MRLLSNNNIHRVNESLDVLFVSNFFIFILIKGNNVPIILMKIEIHALKTSLPTKKNGVQKNICNNDQYKGEWKT